MIAIFFATAFPLFFPGRSSVSNRNLFSLDFYPYYSKSEYLTQVIEKPVLCSFLPKYNRSFLLVLQNFFDFLTNFLLFLFLFSPHFLYVLYIFSLLTYFFYKFIIAFNKCLYIFFNSHKEEIAR